MVRRVLTSTNISSETIRTIVLSSEMHLMMLFVNYIYAMTEVGHRVKMEVF